MKKRIMLSLSLVTLVAFATLGQDQLAKSMQEVRAEAAQTSEQLRATLHAINALTEQTKGDLRPVYNTFAAQVTNTFAAAKATAARVQWMEGDGEKYFTEWQASITSLANPSLRKKSQKRLESVRKSYAGVKAELKEASEKFKPFLSDLSDIQKTLAMDVTAAGVKSVRSTVKSANWNYQAVERTIRSALKEMDKMAKELSPQAT